MRPVFARQLLAAVALAPMAVGALWIAPAEAGVTASLVSNQIIVTSNVPGKNYSALNGQSSVNLSAAQSPDQGFSVDALSSLNASEISFKNGAAALGFGTDVEVVTGIAITFTNSENVAVKPVLQSTLIAAGLGVFLTPQVKSGAFGNPLASASCTSSMVKNCGEPNSVQAADLSQQQPLSAYGNSSSGFDFNVSVGNQSIYDLNGSVGINSNGFYSNLAAAASTLAGFTRVTANGDPYALGYNWGNTPVDIALPGLLQPGQSVTAIYTVTTYVDMAANGGCKVGNIGYGPGAACEVGYSSFGDPVGRGGGIGNGASTGQSQGVLGAGRDLSPDILAPAGPNGNNITDIITDAEAVFENLTPVYDPITGEYTANVPATIIVAGGIPEPATWALMLSGVGLLGAALRRRRGVLA